MTKHTMQQMNDMIDATLKVPVRVYQVRPKAMALHSDRAYERAVTLNTMEGKAKPHAVAVDFYYEKREAAD